VSGSDYAAEQRRALGDPASNPMLLIDAELRVVAIAGGDGSFGDASSLMRASLAEVIDPSSDGDVVIRAATDAVRGIDGALTVETRSFGTATVTFLPLRGAELGAARALVCLSPGLPLEAELDELRTRASDLEALGRAARALARSTGMEELGRIVCEAASDVASADVVALLEPSPDEAALIVTSSSEPDIVGATVQLGQPSLAGRALREAGAVYEPDLMPHGAAAWPLRQCGARSAVWHPVQGERGARALIALGWRRPMRQTERLRASLELLAGETGVAMDRAASLERLTVLARTDPLTDLSNRRAWQDELARELSRADRGGEPLSIGLIDLDDFKAFNDRWGHAAGDRLLLTAAARWRRRLRLSDLLARIGGDEFAVILPACEIEQAAALGDQLRAALPDGLSCSIGVTEWVPGESAERVLDRADRALYAAKDAGRNRVVAAPAPTEAPH
jgi:diguanylate cyclase (GGDEF)-like protein